LRREGITLDLDPVEYLRQVMNDPTAAPERRDLAAVVLLPYVHPRISDNRKGKRDLEREAALEPPPPGSEWKGLLDPPGIARTNALGRFPELRGKRSPANAVFPRGSREFENRDKFPLLLSGPTRSRRSRHAHKFQELVEFVGYDAITW
jgi:hypothetical protein